MTCKDLRMLAMLLGTITTMLDELLTGAGCGAVVDDPTKLVGAPKGMKGCETAGLVFAGPGELVCEL